MKNTSTVYARNKGRKQLGVFLQVLNKAPEDMKVSDLILALNQGPMTDLVDGGETGPEKASDDSVNRWRYKRMIPGDSDDEEIPVPKPAREVRIHRLMKINRTLN